MPQSHLTSLRIAHALQESFKKSRYRKSYFRADLLAGITVGVIAIPLSMPLAIASGVAPQYGLYTAMVGVVLASLLFTQELAKMSKVSDISQQSKHVPETLPEGWKVLKVNGALFFAAADRIFTEMQMLGDGQRGLVIYLDGVPTLDGGGLNTMLSFIEQMQANNTKLIFADLQYQPLKTLKRAGVEPLSNQVIYSATLAEALKKVFELEKC